jgi:predicted dehydrogenase
VYARDKMSFTHRTITAPQRFGEQIPVEVPTHLAGVLEFENGALLTLSSSFDVWKSDLPDFELYGTLGSLRLGKLGVLEAATLFEFAPAHSDSWTAVPHAYVNGLRFGGGVAEMAAAILDGRPHRAQGDIAYHVFDVLQSLADSARTNQPVTVESTCQRPEPLPPGLTPGSFEAPN